MKSLTMWLLSIGAAWAAIGCVNVKMDEPLVDLGQDKTSRPKSVSDPAPGVSRENLTQEQRLQRDLAHTQQLLKSAEEKTARAERKREEDKLDSKKDIRRLEDRLKNLEKENDRLRDSLENCREKND